MGTKTRQLILGAACAVGLAFSGAAAQADGAKGTPPRIDKSSGNVQLIYPTDAQAKGEEGSIDFALYISAGGHPTGRYKIYKSTGHPDLDNAALESALGWPYVPGKNAGGETVSAWVPIHLEFRLPKKPASGEASAKPSQ